MAVLLLLVLSQCTGMLPVFRDVLQRYLEINDGQYGLLFSFGFLGGLLSILPGGIMVDRRGPKAVIRLSLAGAGIAFLVLACAGNAWWGIAVGLALRSMMVRPLGLAVNTFLVQIFPGCKRRAISLNAVALSGGEFIFPACAEMLLFVTKRFKAVSFAMVLHAPFAFVAAMLALGGLLFRPGMQAAAPRQEPRHWMHCFRFRPSTWGLIVLCALHGTADSVLFFWWPRFLGSAAFAAQPVPPGFFLSGFAVAYLLSRVSLAALPEDRWRRRLMVFPGLIGGGTLILGILSRDYMLTGLAYIIGAFFWSAEYPSFLARIAHGDTSRFGAALAMQQMFVSAGAMIGLALVGFLVEATSEANMWALMLAPASGFIVCGLGAWIWIRRSLGT